MHVAPDLTTQAPRRRWPAVSTAITWCGAVAFPAALYVSTHTGAHDSAGLVLIGVAVLALLLLVRLLLHQPLVALALGLIGLVAAITPGRTWEVGYLQVLAIDAAVVYIVATRTRRVSAIAVVMALGTQILLATSSADGANLRSTTVASIVLAMVTAWAVGSSIRNQRRHAEAIRAQATARAVTDERLRIARELHDVISHSIGSIAIQAGMGSRVIDTQPAEARNALAAIEATSRETLAGLRRTLGALRRTDPEPGPGGTLVDPTPGLDDIDRLVASVLDAGVHVELHWRGERRPLPPDVDLAAFRIIQEAVTNVVRHARTPSCRVTVHYSEAEVSITVDDDGHGGLVTGDGYGIAGMRERAELLRGRFSAGPRPEGGFQVTARLPLRQVMR